MTKTGSLWLRQRLRRLVETLWRQRTRRNRVAKTLAFVLASAAIAQETRAQGVEVPATLAFEGSDLAIIASDLVLRVVVDSEATEGRVEIKNPGVAVAAGEFSFDAQQGVLTRQLVEPAATGADGAAQATADPFVVEIEVVLPAGGVLTIDSRYSEIEVLTRGDASSARTTVRGEVGNGQVSVAGALAVELVVREATLQVTGSTEAPAGPIKLDLSATTAQIDEISGASTVVSNDSTVSVAGAIGSLTLKQQGGSMTIVGSTAALSGSAVNGSVEVEEVTASDIVLSLANSELTVTRSSFSKLQLTARESIAGLVQTEGSATLDWISGSLQMQGHVGNATLTLKNSASAEISGLLDPIVLVVEKSQASLENVGNVMLRVRDGSAGVEGCKALGVDARGAELTLIGFETQRAWAIDNSQVVVDFAGAGRRTKLKLDGGSTASVRLPGPCFVRFAGRSNLLDSEYRISGCEVLTADPTQRKRLRFGGLDGLDGSSGTILQLDLSPDSSATVEESSN